MQMAIARFTGVANKPELTSAKGGKWTLAAFLVSELFELRRHRGIFVELFETDEQYEITFSCARTLIVGWIPVVDNITISQCIEANGLHPLFRELGQVAEVSGLVSDEREVQLHSRATAQLDLLSDAVENHAVDGLFAYPRAKPN